jgi:hypothetical protein
VDASGDVIALTGNFTGAFVPFGSGSLTSQGDSDIFMLRFNASGADYSRVSLGSPGSDTGESVAVDGSGNIVLTGYTGGLAWLGGETFAARGALDLFVTKWKPSGQHIWSGTFGGLGTEIGNSIATDASGNVVVTGYIDGAADFGGTELVSAGSQDVFLAKYGAIAGDPYPFITSIADIGNDQGRKVKVRFDRSGGDDAGAVANPVTRYVVFRRDAPAPATSALESAAPGKMLDTGWTEVGSVSAFAAASYGIDVPTIGDSTIALGQYHSVFRVRAATDRPSLYFTSEQDSGYSLDNLAPGIPGSFLYTAGDLTWDESSAGDFDYFSIYGANTNSFGAATLVDYAVGPTLDVTASPYVYYFVTATDFSGNEGKPAVVNTLSGVGGTPKSYVLSVGNYPNPFNPRTTIRYTVPSRGAVSIVVYDAHGARVATLFNGERAAGAYSVTWDGRTDDAAVAASGVYFARIEHNGATRTRKMMLLK